MDGETDDMILTAPSAAHEARSAAPRMQLLEGVPQGVFTLVQSAKSEVAQAQVSASCKPVPHSTLLGRDRSHSRCT